jgi:hypothetical protein
MTGMSCRMQLLQGPRGPGAEAKPAETAGVIDSARPGLVF